jgi:hypothetical protein
MSAAGCRGLASLWLTLGGATGPPVPVHWLPDFRAGDLMIQLDLQPCMLGHAPLTPPPRSTGAVSS